MFKMARKINYASNSIRKWSLKKREEWRGEWDKVEDQLDEGQQLLKINGVDSPFIQARHEARNLTKIKASYWRQQTKAKWMKEGNACTR